MQTRAFKAMAAEVADASQTYQSGQMTFNGNVNIEYDLIISP